VIYTSGTTGIPKGVMLTHGNMASNLNWSSVDFHFGGDERRLSLLPLSHITERHLGYVDFIFEQVTYYAESIEKVPENLLEVHPTFLVAVPRVFEKVAAKTRAEVTAKPKVVQCLFNWAREVGRQMGPYWLDGWPTFGPDKRSRAGNAMVPPLGLRLKAAVADRLVYRKLRQRMGGQLNKAVSGGAPLGKELAEFMLSLGIVIDQGYGLTETAPVIAINRPGQRRIGSVGRPLRIVEVMIAEDGELLVRGPSVFSGYWGLPDETEEALRGGWFHTGDIGYVDDDGYVYITDRKKDLIKTSGGKFIAPQPIECRLKDSAWIGEAVLVGEKRKYVSALLVPNFPAIEEYARHNGIAWETAQELTRQPEIRSLFEAEVERINAGLARFETIKRFALLSQPFSIEGGEITPTIKVRRRTIELKYRDVIETLYDAE
jgi:long-chain acyl-CoA synthetase